MSLRRGMMAQASGGSGGSSHRYWRILCLANNGGGAHAISEIEFRATVGGADQTLALSSAQSYVTSSSNINSSNPEWHAFNGTPSNTWISATDSSGEWIKYDFVGAGGSAVEVHQVAISGHIWAPTWTVKDFDVQFSDDNSAWTTALSVTNQTGWDNGETRLFSVP